MKNGQIKPSSQKDAVLQTPTRVPPTDKVDTSDWKTYRNEEYGFEFMYPNDWIIGNEKGPPGLSLTKYKGDILPRSYYIRATFLVYAVNDPRLLNNTGYLGENYQASSIEGGESIRIRQITIKDRQLSSLQNHPLYNQFEYDSNGCFKNLYITYGDQVLRIRITPKEPKLMSVFDQILSTFRFI